MLVETYLKKYARALWEKQGSCHGKDKEDWIEAEKRYKETIHLLHHASQPLSHPGFKHTQLIGDHNAIAEEYGIVYYGMAGKAVADDRLKEFNDQIEKGLIPTLIVAWKEKTWNYNQAEMKGAYRICPDLTRVPVYYKVHYSKIDTWIGIGRLEQMGSEEFGKYVKTKERTSPQIDNGQFSFCYLSYED